MEINNNKTIIITQLVQIKPGANSYYQPGQEVKISDLQDKDFCKRHPNCFKYKKIVEKTDSSLEEKVTKTIHKPKRTRKEPIQN